MSRGFLFFVLGLASAIAYHSDNLVISNMLGPDEVGSYALPMKLFIIGPTILGLILSPLWPAYGEAIARGDISWVKQALRRSFLAGLAIELPFVVAMMWTGPWLIRIWSDGLVSLPTQLLVGFAVWSLLAGVLTPLAMLYNGANVIFFQAVWASVAALTNLALSIFLVGRIGVAGAIYGTVSTQLLFLVIPYSLRLKRLLAELETRGATSLPVDLQVELHGRVVPRL